MLTVELFPREMNAPATSQEIEQKLTSRSPTRRLILWRIKTSSEIAIEWYKACRAGAWFRPTKDGEFRLEEAYSTPLGNLLEEPRWPGLVLTHEGVPVHMPFVPLAHSSPRIHHLLSETMAQEQWTPTQRQQAEEIVKRFFGFDMSYWPELWGSAHLIVPNPLFRSVKVMDISTEEQAGVRVRVEMREDTSVDGLTLHLWDQRTTGKTYFITTALQEAEVDFVLPQPVEQVGEAIISRDHGLLYYSGPNYFLATIQATMNIVTARRNVPALRSGESGYNVSLVGFQLPMQIGGAPPQHRAVELLHHGQRRRDMMLTESQRWFNGNQAEAIQEIRSLIGKARNRLLIVDPYLGSEELIRFGLASSFLDVTIRMLTSQYYLSGKARFPTQVDGATETKSDEPGDLLVAAIASLQGQELMNLIEVRVMRGNEKPALHDRFIVCDQEVWLLGSSLNEFGSRGTMMVRLAHPEPVAEELERVFAQEPLLGVWHQKRIARRSRRS